MKLFKKLLRELLFLDLMKMLQKWEKQPVLHVHSAVSREMIVVSKALHIRLRTPPSGAVTAPSINIYRSEHIAYNSLSSSQMPMPDPLLSDSIRAS